MKFIHILPILALVTTCNSSRDTDVRSRLVWIIVIIIVNSLRHSSSAISHICHKTSNEKCPWMNLKVEETSLGDHLNHGDKEGTCEETCELCSVFDEATCRCSFVRETSKLMAPDKEEYDYFGSSVSISGNVAIVGANGSGPLGSAYVFVKNASTGDWNEVAKLIASDGDNFGVSVSISGNVAIVGADRSDDRGYSSGSA